MIDKTIISASLVGMVGIKQPTNPDYDIIDSTNQGSTTARYITDNSFVKVELLKDCYDYSAATDANINAWLLQMQKSAISNVLDRVFNKPDFIDRQVLYQYESNKINTETSTGFVGYRIKQCLDKNMSFTISRVILEMQAACDIKLMLFNSAKSDPIYTKEIKYVAEIPAEGETPAVPEVPNVTAVFHEEVLNWTIRNTQIYKGDYYFGYIITTQQPYARDFSMSNFKSVWTGLELESINIPAHTTETMFDLNDIKSSSLCHGINLDISINYDYTDFIIQNKLMFALPIQLQWQIDAITAIISSIRSNKNERLGQDMIMKLIAEIEGVEQTEGVNKIGLKSLISGEIKRLQIEIEKIQEGLFGSGIVMHTLS